MNMDRQQTIEQVEGILVREELEYDKHADGESFRLLFGDSTAVFIHVDTWRDGTMVTVSSPVLSDIEPDGVGAAEAHARLNELNRTHRFLKFVFLEDDLLAAYDLLGDTLRRQDLVNAVHLTATAAERVAGELYEATGGLTYDEVLELAETEH